MVSAHQFSPVWPAMAPRGGCSLAPQDSDGRTPHLSFRQGWAARGREGPTPALLEGCVHACGLIVLLSISFINKMVWAAWSDTTLSLFINTFSKINMVKDLRGRRFCRVSSLQPWSQTRSSALRGLFHVLLGIPWWLSSWEACRMRVLALLLPFFLLF